MLDIRRREALSRRVIILSETHEHLGSFMLDESATTERHAENLVVEALRAQPVNMPDCDVVWRGLRIEVKWGENVHANEAQLRNVIIHVYGFTARVYMPVDRLSVEGEGVARSIIPYVLERQREREEAGERAASRSTPLGRFGFRAERHVAAERRMREERRARLAPYQMPRFRGTGRGAPASGSLGSVFGEDHFTR